MNLQPVARQADVGLGEFMSAGEEAVLDLRPGSGEHGRETGRIGRRNDRIALPGYDQDGLSRKSAVRLAIDDTF